ncbi:MAG: 30S ribosome-binding factor RbfA [Deltaproteobacteria bacterium]|nr:30S ribosome-binding factor RbfA [Deltaproteobacteria bacterium]
MIPNRKARLGSLLLEEISEMLHKGIKDPRLEMVSITEVSVSDDLKVAKIYYCVYGDEKKQEDARLGFESAQGYIRRELIKRLNIKRIPELWFIFDSSFDNANKINQLLLEIHKKYGE